MSNSLFSTIITLYILILLYLPSPLLHSIFSHVLISTFILLLYLLRLGAEEQNNSVVNEPNSNELNSTEPHSTHYQTECSHDHDHDHDHDTIIELKSSNEKDKTTSFYSDSFVEWDVRAPLEVIYEEHDEEEGEGQDIGVIQRYASLSLCYPESDSDATSSEDEFPANGDWRSPDNMGFRWEDEDDEEDDRDGLYEIRLDGKRNGEFEEDNLIEIELF